MPGMASKWAWKSKKNCVFLKSAQKWQTAFRLRRRERIEDRALQKNKEKLQKKQSANQHTYNTDFTPKGGPTYNDETCENLTTGSLYRPSIPKPLYLKS